MESYKIKVNNEAESKEAQDLFFELGFGWCCGDIKKMRNISASYIYCYKISKDMTFGNSDESFYNHKNKEITLQYLRDLVVLKRNSVDDANYESESGNIKYYLTDTEFFEFILGVWVNIDELVDGMSFKFIDKEGEVKMKEYLDKEYRIRKVKQTSGDNLVPKGWIEVPEGAEIFLLDESCGEDTLYFVKHDGEVFHEYYIDTAYVQNNTWIKGTVIYLHKGMGEILWERNLTKTDTSIQYKLKFIEKWLNGEKIQYILGIESEKTQWHNFTEGAMQYIKRSDIKFREAPKYVTINGIEFKSVERLLKHVKNNFDLEDGSKSYEP